MNDVERGQFERVLDQLRECSRLLYRDAPRIGGRRTFTTFEYSDSTKELIRARREETRLMLEEIAKEVDNAPYPLSSISFFLRHISVCDSRDLRTYFLREPYETLDSIIRLLHEYLRSQC